MGAIAPAVPALKDDRERVSLVRLLWVAPLTVTVAVAVNYLIKVVAQALDPSLARMGQLGPPLISLTLQGAVGAVVLFALLALLVRRPITWFRRIAVALLVLSLLPDLALGLGGQTAMLGMRAMGPFLGLEIPGLSGPSGGGPPPSGGPRPGGGPSGGGPPAGFVMPAMAAEQVLLLILLHVATAVVCIVLLTTLTRDRSTTEPATT
jgi:Family of unknown function (DUF6069)